MYSTYRASHATIPALAHEDLKRYFVRAYLHDRAKGFRIGGIRRTKRGHDTRGEEGWKNQARRTSTQHAALRTDPAEDAADAAARAVSLLHSPPRALRKLFRRAGLFWDNSGGLTHRPYYDRREARHAPAYDPAASATAGKPVRARLPVPADDWQTLARITRYYLSSRQWRETADEDRPNGFATRGRSTKRPPPIGSAAARGDNPALVAEWTAERAQTPHNYITQPPRRPEAVTHRITSSRRRVVAVPGTDGRLANYVQDTEVRAVVRWMDRRAEPPATYRVTQRGRLVKVRVSPTDAAEILGHGMPAERVVGWQRCRGGVATHLPSARVTTWQGPMRDVRANITYEPGVAAITEAAAPRVYRRRMARWQRLEGYRPRCCRCGLSHRDIVTPCCKGG